MQECHHRARRQPQTVCRRLWPWPPPALSPCGGRGAGVGLPRRAGRARAARAAPPAMWGALTAHRPSPATQGDIKQRRTKAPHSCLYTFCLLPELSVHVQAFSYIVTKTSLSSNGFTKGGIFGFVCCLQTGLVSLQGGEHDHISHVSIPRKSPGFPNKSSRNSFALYSFEAATIGIQVKDMKESYQP